MATTVRVDPRNQINGYINLKYRPLADVFIRGLDRMVRETVPIEVLAGLIEVGFHNEPPTMRGQAQHYWEAWVPREMRPRWLNAIEAGERSLRKAKTYRPGLEEVRKQASPDQRTYWGLRSHLRDRERWLQDYLSEEIGRKVAMVLAAAARNREWGAGNTARDLRRVLLLLPRDAERAIRQYELDLMTGSHVDAVKRLRELTERKLRERANRFAQHELAQMWNKGVLESMKDRLREGEIDPDTKKVWLTTNDDRVCPICGPLHEKELPLDKDFRSEGFEGQSPPAHIGCRCALAYKRRPWPDEMDDSGALGALFMGAATAAAGGAAATALLLPVMSFAGVFPGNPDLKRTVIGMTPSLVDAVEDALSPRPGNPPGALVPETAVWRAVERLRARPGQGPGYRSGGELDFLTQDVIDEVKKKADKEWLDWWTAEVFGGRGAEQAPRAPFELWRDAQGPEVDLETIFHERVSGQMGSIPGGLYRGSDGRLRYVKYYDDPAQAHGELIANAIYRMLNFEAPGGRIVPAPNESGYRWAIVNEWIDNDGPLGFGPYDEDDAREILQGYALDVLTANWDTVGLAGDNVVRLPGGAGFARIDQGGVFLHRAKAGRKPKDLLHQLTEWDNFLNPSVNREYSEVWEAAGYRGPFDQEWMEELVFQIEALDDFRARVGGWEAFVNRIDPTFRSAYRNDFNAVVQMLDKRTDLLVRKAAGLRKRLHRLDPAIDELRRLPPWRLVDIEWTDDQYDEAVRVMARSLLDGWEEGLEGSYAPADMMLGAAELWWGHLPDYDVRLQRFVDSFIRGRGEHYRVLIQDVSQDTDRNALQVILRAIHQDTQAYLKELGYGPEDYVTLYRGLSEPTVPLGESKWIDVDAWPLSSWSLNPQMATQFMSEGFGEEVGSLLATRIKAKDIVGITKRNLGDPFNLEVVVKGAEPIRALELRGDELTSIGRAIGFLDAEAEEGFVFRGFDGGMRIPRIGEPGYEDPNWESFFRRLHEEMERADGLEDPVSGVPAKILGSIRMARLQQEVEEGPARVIDYWEENNPDRLRTTPLIIGDRMLGWPSQTPEDFLLRQGAVEEVAGHRRWDSGAVAFALEQQGDDRVIHFLNAYRRMYPEDITSGEDAHDIIMRLLAQKRGPWKEFAEVLGDPPDLPDEIDIFEFFVDTFHRQEVGQMASLLEEFPELRRAVAHWIFDRINEGWDEAGGTWLPFGDDRPWFFSHMEAVRQELRAGGSVPDTDDIDEDLVDALRPFVRVYYERAQDALREAGFGPDDTILLYRAVWNPDAEEGRKKSFRTRAVSAWTWDPLHAEEFGNRFIIAEVSVKDVYSVGSRVGLGKAHEAEIVLKNPARRYADVIDLHREFIAPILREYHSQGIFLSYDDFTVETIGHTTTISLIPRLYPMRGVPLPPTREWVFDWGESVQKVVSKYTGIPPELVLTRWTRETLEELDDFDVSEAASRLIDNLDNPLPEMAPEIVAQARLARLAYQVQNDQVEKLRDAVPDPWWTQLRHIILTEPRAVALERHRDFSPEAAAKFILADMRADAAWPHSPELQENWIRKWAEAAGFDTPDSLGDDLLDDDVDRLIEILRTPTGDDAQWRALVEIIRTSPTARRAVTQYAWYMLQDSWIGISPEDRSLHWTHHWVVQQQLRLRVGEHAHLDQIDEDYVDLLKPMVDIQYQRTQLALREAGIDPDTKIPLYRGMWISLDEDREAYKTRALESYTWDSAWIPNFGENFSIADVDAKDIYSIGGPTSMGSELEGEMIVLGRRQWRDAKLFDLDEEILGPWVERLREQGEDVDIHDLVWELDRDRQEFVISRILPNTEWEELDRYESVDLMPFVIARQRRIPPELVLTRGNLQQLARLSDEDLTAAVRRLIDHLEDGLDDAGKLPIIPLDSQDRSVALRAAQVVAQQYDELTPDGSNADVVLGRKMAQRIEEAITTEAQDASFRAWLEGSLRRSFAVRQMLQFYSELTDAEKVPLRDVWDHLDVLRQSERGFFQEEGVLRPPMERLLEQLMELARVDAPDQTVRLFFHRFFLRQLHEDWASATDDYLARIAQFASTEELGSTWIGFPIEGVGVNDFGEYYLIDRAERGLVEYMKVVVRQIYDAEQDYLRRFGFRPGDKVLVYRGMLTGEAYPPGEVGITMRPLSSWSLRPTDAAGFGDFDELYVAEIAIEDIFSIGGATPGIGTFHEAEVVTLGQGVIRARHLGRDTLLTSIREVLRRDPRRWQIILNDLRPDPGEDILRLYDDYVNPMMPGGRLINRLTGQEIRGVEFDWDEVWEEALRVIGVEYRAMPSDQDLLEKTQRTAYYGLRRDPHEDVVQGDIPGYEGLDTDVQPHPVLTHWVNDFKHRFPHMVTAPTGEVGAPRPRRIIIGSLPDNAPRVRSAGGGFALQTDAVAGEVVGRAVVQESTVGKLIQLQEKLEMIRSGRHSGFMLIEKEELSALHLLYHELNHLHSHQSRTLRITSEFRHIEAAIEEGLVEWMARQQVISYVQDHLKGAMSQAAISRLPFDNSHRRPETRWLFNFVRFIYDDYPPGPRDLPGDRPGVLTLIGGGPGSALEPAQEEWYKLSRRMSSMIADWWDVGQPPGHLSQRLRWSAMERDAWDRMNEFFDVIVDVDNAVEFEPELVDMYGQVKAWIGHYVYNMIPTQNDIGQRVKRAEKLRVLFSDPALRQGLKELTEIPVIEERQREGLLFFNRIKEWVEGPSPDIGDPGLYTARERVPSGVLERTWVRFAGDRWDFNDPEMGRFLDIDPEWLTEAVDWIRERGGRHWVLVHTGSQDAERVFYRAIETGEVGGDIPRVFSEIILPAYVRERGIEPIHWRYSEPTYKIIRDTNRVTGGWDQSGIGLIRETFLPPSRQELPGVVGPHMPYAYKPSEGIPYFKTMEESVAFRNALAEVAARWLDGRIAVGAIDRETAQAIWNKYYGPDASWGRGNAWSIEQAAIHRIAQVLAEGTPVPVPAPTRAMWRRLLPYIEEELSYLRNPPMDLDSRARRVFGRVDDFRYWTGALTSTDWVMEDVEAAPPGIERYLNIVAEAMEMDLPHLRQIDVGREDIEAVMSGGGLFSREQSRVVFGAMSNMQAWRNSPELWDQLFELDNPQREGMLNALKVALHELHHASSQTARSESIAGATPRPGTIWIEEGIVESLATQKMMSWLVRHYPNVHSNDIMDATLAVMSRQPETTFLRILWEAISTTPPGGDDSTAYATWLRRMHGMGRRNRIEDIFAKLQSTPLPDFERSGLLFNQANAYDEEHLFYLIDAIQEIEPAQMAVLLELNRTQPGTLKNFFLRRFVDRWESGPTLQEIIDQQITGHMGPPEPLGVDIPPEFGWLEPEPDFMPSIGETSFFEQSLVQGSEQQEAWKIAVTRLMSGTDDYGKLAIEMLAKTRKERWIYIFQRIRERVFHTEFENQQMKETILHSLSDVELQTYTTDEWLDFLDTFTSVLESTDDEDSLEHILTRLYEGG